MDVSNLINKQVDFVNHLNVKYQNVLRWYTGGNFDVFNMKLRQNKNLSEEEQDKLKNMDYMFSLVPPINGSITVYKGKNSSSVYPDKSFISTSISYEQALKFAGKDCCILEITVSAGSKILPLFTVSRELEENEILLDRDGILSVTGSSIKSLNNREIKIIYVTYMPKTSIVVHDQKQVDKATKQFDQQLIIERLTELLKSEEDPDFIDDETINYYYKKITGKPISQENLNKIKNNILI